MGEEEDVWSTSPRWCARTEEVRYRPQMEGRKGGYAGFVDSIERVRSAKGGGETGGWRM